MTIFSYIHRRITVREDAEDILLEVFLASLENETIASLGEEQQRAWLLRVAHHKIVDYFRYWAVRGTAIPLDDAPEMLDDTQGAEPEQALFQQEEYAQLQANIKQLPALQQEIVRLRFALGLRYAEIAQRLNKREGTIRQLLSRSLRFLRTIYTHQ